MAYQPKVAITQKPISTTNYTKGRGKPIKYITFHHIVGSLQSCFNKFNTPNVQVSSTYGVGPNVIWQFIPQTDTPYTNGNWGSNQECITIEHEGTWLNGFRNEDTLKTSAELVAHLRSIYPNIGYNRHRDVSATACPGDFPVEEVWAMATKLLNPAPAIPDAVKITPTVYKANLDSVQIWDLTTHPNYKSVKTLKKGDEFEAYAEIKFNGNTYLVTKYSFDRNIKNGVNKIDMLNWTAELARQAELDRIAAKKAAAEEKARIEAEQARLEALQAEKDREAERLAKEALEALEKANKEAEKQKEADRENLNILGLIFRAIKKFIEAILAKKGN